MNSPSELIGETWMSEYSKEVKERPKPKGKSGLTFLISYPL